MKNSIFIINEVKNNLSKLIRIAFFDIKIKYNETFLGAWWNILNPALQIFVYWFVFTIGFRAAAPKGDVPFLIWLIAGMFPWFFISTSITQSTNSIVASRDILKRLSFPIAIIPLKAIVASSLEFIVMIVVELLIMRIYDITPGWYLIQFIYYLTACIVLLSGLAYIFSAINVMARDFAFFLGSMLRMLMYITPIFWSPEGLNSKLLFIIKLNPFYYIINGMRDSFLYKVPTIIHPLQGAYFWVLTITVFIVGCNVHMKFRNRFLDLV